MDVGKATVVIVVTLILVIGINAVIYYTFSRRRDYHEIDLLRKASQSARDPWKVENDALQDLSKRVADLKKGSPANSDQDHSIDRNRGEGNG